MEEVRCLWTIQHHRQVSPPDVIWGDTVDLPQVAAEGPRGTDVVVLGRWWQWTGGGRRW